MCEVRNALELIKQRLQLEAMLDYNNYHAHNGKLAEQLHYSGRLSALETALQIVQTVEALDENRFYTH